MKNFRSLVEGRGGWEDGVVVLIGLSEVVALGLEQRQPSSAKVR